MNPPLSACLNHRATASNPESSTTDQIRHFSSAPDRSHHRAMDARRLSLLALSLAVMPLATRAAPPALDATKSATQTDDRVVIYRCSDAQGRLLALRDSPCLRGERQDIRNMARPKNPAAKAQTSAPAAPTAQALASASPAPQVVYLNPPRPLYECRGPNDERYLNDTSEGRLRWVSFVGQLPVYDPSYGFVHIGDGGAQAGYHAGGHRNLLVSNGTWVRDTCHVLPQADACQRLRQQHSTLGRRFFNAQPSERARIDQEEHSLKARIAQDCR
jgi:hypothetical protein